MRSVSAVCSTGVSSSQAASRTGGAGAKRPRPPTSSVSVPRSWRLSRERSLRSALSVRHAVCLPMASWCRTCSVSAAAYQTARVDRRAKPRTALRQDRTTAVRRSSRSEPFWLPATAKLAARRNTSHSHGPGAASSKSLRSNSNRRSGVTNTPKLDRRRPRAAAR